MSIFGSYFFLQVISNKVEEANICYLFSLADRLQVVIDRQNIFSNKNKTNIV
jgi:hypothetical protein